VYFLCQLIGNDVRRGTNQHLSLDFLLLIAFYKVINDRGTSNGLSGARRPLNQAQRHFQGLFYCVDLINIKFRKIRSADHIPDLDVHFRRLWVLAQQTVVEIT
jgi:hypothetical protein